MEVCKACQHPLTVLVKSGTLNDDHIVGVSSSTDCDHTVDDDVELQCGCHFHWQCLLDAYNITECPSCGEDTARGTGFGDQQVLCNIKNEGGLQEGIDILPLLAEESYLKAFPEERRCRAFLEFCGDGDVEAIVDLLDDDDDDDDDDDEVERDAEENGKSINETRVDVLRYQDSMGSMSSGLHASITHGKPEVAWLLLLLASTLPMSQFPLEVLQAADRLQLSREDQTGKVDIRTLRDSQGMTAAQRAMTAGGIWNDWLAAGRLTA